MGGVLCPGNLLHPPPSLPAGFLWQGERHNTKEYPSFKSMIGINFFKVENKLTFIEILVRV
jgi:hypothetical protein